MFLKNIKEFAKCFKTFTVRHVMIGVMVGQFDKVDLYIFYLNKSY